MYMPMNFCGSHTTLEANNTLPLTLHWPKGRFLPFPVALEIDKVKASSRGDGVTSAFSKLRPIWISHLYYFFPKMGKLK